MTGLRFEVEGEAEPMSLEPTLNFLCIPTGPSGRRRAEALAKVFKENIRLFTLHHQHAGQGQGDLRPLARLQGCGRQPAPRQPRRARGGRGAGCGRARGLSAHCRIATTRMKAKWLGKDEARLLGPQRAAARKARAADRLGGAQAMVLGPTAASRRNGGDRQALLRRRLDRCAGARRQGARRLLASDGAIGAPLHPHRTTRASRAT